MNDIEFQLWKLSKLGKEELRRKHLIYLSGQDNGMHSSCFELMYELGFISLEDFAFIIR